MQLVAAMALTRAVLLPEPVAMTPAASVCPLPALAASAAADVRRLSQAVARGDEAAFRQLYDAYSDRVLRLAILLARGDVALARDVTQTVWLGAARKMKPLQSDAHLWNWLALVTRQQAARALRDAAGRTSEVSLAEMPDHPAPADADTLLEECLNAAVQCLEAEDRRLIESFYFEHRSCEHIAGQLGTTAKAISSRLERARARLRSLVRRILAHEA
jgi:RNA polymerase sigma-70 factor, ECF subfamily